ncbi:hypothetical protein OESDEN_16005 [Oesophagostomum dentatum]|uniref:Chromo domain-containing protein n=1 Tax=Oesophagostomum dentatum TaxID=61180 RepID=A0A0B1SH79_OESDE|nr:hypothetical protein OESDEN_16005 [Oesophagostomum dentatum]
MGRDKKKDEDDDSGDDVYVVEAVINKRKAKDGKVEYLLKWQSRVNAELDGEIIFMMIKQVKS